MASISVQPGQKSVYHVPVAGAKAEVFTETPIPKSGMTVTGILVNLAAAGSPQTPIQWFLRDGIGGAVKLTGFLSASANSHAGVNLTGLSIQTAIGSPAHLHFDGPGAFGSRQSVTIIYYQTNLAG